MDRILRTRNSKNWAPLDRLTRIYFQFLAELEVKGKENEEVQELYEKIQFEIMKYQMEINGVKGSALKLESFEKSNQKCIEELDKKIKEEEEKLRKLKLVFEERRKIKNNLHEFDQFSKKVKSFGSMEQQKKRIETIELSIAEIGKDREKLVKLWDDKIKDFSAVVKKIEDLED